MASTRTDTELWVKPAASRKDVKLAARLLSTSSVRQIAKEQKDEPGCIRILYRGDEAVGAIIHVRETWDLGEAILKVARIVECTGETGDAAFRHTGDRSGFDALVSEWSEYLKGEGYHLAYAHGELALWPVHGFYPSFFHPRVYVPTAKALKLSPAYKVRGIKSSDLKPMLKMLDRNRHLRPRVFATGVPNFHHYAVEGPKRTVHGYFSMSVNEGNGTPSVFIPEAEVENREAAETILAHAAPYAQERGMRALHFPLAASHPFSMVCLDLGGYHQMRGTTRDVTLDEEMVRIVDLRACFAAFSGEFAARLRGSGTGDGQAELLFDVEEETVGCRLSGETLVVADDLTKPVRIRIPRWALTQLVMGYRSVEQLKQNAVQPASARKLLSVLFPRTWPLSLCDHDLWDPNLRDTAKYCTEALTEIRKLRYPF